MKREYFTSGNEETLEKDAEHYAKEVGIITNPNKEKFRIVMKGLLNNKNKKGELYCPCRTVTGNKEKDKDIICPCVFHRGEIELEGQCRCMFFFEKK
jgi:ferredoxin-thioredoxin reductase catalytic chain